MEISVTDAKAQLTELVRRVEAGDDVVLTRHGKPAARLVAMEVPVDRAKRRAVIEAVRKGALDALPGPSAARSQDFLYDDETGLPG